MKRFLLLFIHLGILFTCVHANTNFLIGVTRHKALNIPIDSVKVYLIKDGVKIDSTYSRMSRVNNRPDAEFTFKDVLSGKYSCIFIHKDYETEERSFEIKKFTKWLDIVYLTPKPKHKIHTLGEAKVQSSRIKFYHKGDTLVFDADAFNLAEGSMLEALIKELPGVELKRNGEIFVNGRKVDELFLNGKDFFRGDCLVLLENLPSYMVKNVKVYEREDLFHPEIVKKPYTMDVVLKKQYAQGWIANTELAGGTNERYLGRLFGLRFTDHSRLSLYGNINNVNDSQKPGQTGEWEPQDVLAGQERTLKGGIDLFVEDKMNMWSFNTSNEVKHSRPNISKEQTNTTFLPSNTMYQRMMNEQLSHNTQWKTANEWKQRFGNKNSLLSPFYTTHTANLNYRTFNSSELTRAVEQDLPFDSLGNGWDLNKLIDATSESQWFAHLLNRTQSSSYQRGYQLNASGNSEMSYINFEEIGLIEPSFNWSYNKENTTNYQQRRIDYPAQEANATSADKTYQHLYGTTPTENYNLTGSLGYVYRIPFGINFSGNVKYIHQYQSSDRSLFNLHDLEQWGIHDERSLKDLPSTRDSLQLAIDARNSYYSTTYNNTVVFTPQVYGEKFWDNNRYKITFQLDLPINIDHTKLFYQRGNIDAIQKRTTHIFNPWIHLQFSDWKKYRNVTFNYSQNTTAPSLVYRLNLTDDVDPLNIQLGNPFLKNTTVYLVDASFSRSQLPHYGNFSTYFMYRRVGNALAYSVLYDTKTGVRTTRPDNVNGNWNIYGNTGYNGCIDKKDRLSLSNTLQYGYLHNVDLTGTTAVERSVVHTVNLIDQLSLKYKIGQHNIGLKGYVSWSNISSDRENFNNMNVADFNYGLTALLQLPWKLQFSTDLTMYSRRGYESSSMNTNDLVWNARLSRTFLGGSLTCFVDGFDLLGNLSNVNRTVNAQGRTETRYNVVPRYAMLHVIYRLNKQPKKKNQ